MDHHLVQATLKLKLKVHRDRAQKQSFKYNIQSLKDTRKKMEYQCSLKKCFEVLGSLAEEMVEDHWQELKKIWTDTCQEVLGKRTREHKEWLTADIWGLVTERKELKQQINRCQDTDLQTMYWNTNRRVKKRVSEQIRGN